MVIDKTFIKPLADAFSTWISSALTEAGQGLTSTAGSTGGGWISSLVGFFGSLFGGASAPTAEMGGLIQSFARGGPILGFASGGAVPILAHGGEYVLQRSAVNSAGAGNIDYINKTGKMPGGGATQVVINGDIIPRQPNLTPSEVVQIVSRDIHNDGPTAGAMKMRVLRNGGGG
jgi:hypothetical protein